MKILLSAFAMAPGRGSEPGVGWNWAIGLAELGHDVMVLTSSRNREAIEAAAPLVHPSLKFVYVSLFGSNKIPFGTVGHYAYYYLWQMCALVTVIRLRSWQSVEIIHHLTYGGVRAGSLLWLLPRRFVIGPIGGGETCPLRLVRPMGISALLKESCRHLINAVVRVSPLFVMAQLRAERIVCKTEQTRRLVAPWFRNKTIVALEIGVSSFEETPVFDSQAISDIGVTDVLFAGRIIYWKGYSIAYEAVQLARKTNPNISAVFVGDGPELARLKFLVPEADRRTRVLGKLNQTALFDLYKHARLFLFPSLHDSSGNVVLESLRFGVPVICLNLGGPPLIVGPAGAIVSVDGKTYHEVVAQLAVSIVGLLADAPRRQELSQKATSRAVALTWQKAILSTYEGLPGFD
jgi:glycosyltransferase involved in cell wall biosynthesis